MQFNEEWVIKPQQNLLLTSDVLCFTFLYYVPFFKDFNWNCNNSNKLSTQVAIKNIFNIVNVNTAIIKLISSNVNKTSQEISWSDTWNIIITRFSTFEQLHHYISYKYIRIIGCISVYYNYGSLTDQWKNQILSSDNYCPITAASFRHTQLKCEEYISRDLEPWFYWLEVLKIFPISTPNIVQNT